MSVIRLGRGCAVERAITDLVGRPVVSHVEVIWDPIVPGTHAARTFLEGEDRAFDFIIGGARLQAVVAADLKPVQFSAWPPTVDRFATSFECERVHPNFVG